MLLLTALSAAGCAKADLAEAEAGAPLPGLEAADSAHFAAGEEWFVRAFAEADGLGPLYNQTRCSSCHDLPTTGGHGAEPVTKFTRWDESEGCSLLEDLGGDLLQASVTAPLRALGIGPESVPTTANAIAELRPPPLYGLGLVEAVAEADILVRADPTDRDGDGISGRAARLADGRVGRFGAKGQHASLRDFVESAAHGELGLTTPRFRDEPTRNGAPLPLHADPVTDPDIEADVVDLLTIYVRLLAPPSAGAIDSLAADVAAGGALFTDIGCADCHVPTLTSGPNVTPALDRKRFRVYSDLLLHDLGPESADVCGRGVEPSEWMTKRLVGLRFRREFMHDARAQSLESAILLHGGEAARTREAYRALGADQRERLMRFLRSL